MKIKISLPCNRNYCGELEVISPRGLSIFGPVPVGARGDDKAAVLHQNVLRDPVLPYGDTPCGRYAVKEIVRSSNADLGPHAVVVLLPVEGDAALADANGRFYTAIHGDEPAQETIRATCGTLRLFNADQEKLVVLLENFDGPIECLVEESIQRKGVAMRVALSACHLSDPVTMTPARGATKKGTFSDSVLTRREALAKAAIITIAGSSIFVAQANRAEGQVTQYTTPAPQPTPDLNDQRAPDLQDIHVSPPPEPSTPEPATPEPATPEPATPEPATPEPATPEPATPEPATPEPATPEPATPEPATPEPATPEPATPEPLRDAPHDQATAAPAPTLAPMSKYGTVTVKNNTDQPIRFLVDGGTQTTAQPGASGTASMISYGRHTVTVYVYGSNGPDEGKKICEQDVEIDENNEDARITCP